VKDHLLQMALVRYDQFPGYLVPYHLAQTAIPTNAALPITMTLSDGTTVTLCDRMVAALGLMERMRLRRQWMLQLNDDVFVVSISATKMLFCENSLTLQRFLTSFMGVYLHGNTFFNHRSLSQQATFFEALMQSGQLFRTTQAINGNLDLSEVHATLVDWNWPDSLLWDDVPLWYNLNRPVILPPAGPDDEFIEPVT
jgi:hypothetical protein